MIEKAAAVSSRRFVTLDQDGTADGWLHVVVEASTGVFYQQQYGGHLCRQGQTEGFPVPVFGPDALDALRRLFEEGVGTECERNVPRFCSAAGRGQRGASSRGSLGFRRSGPL
ncbi:DUF6210 family protein [Streptomyces sp. ML-6]|uniref:DUF6210 family protein n=1 Tax=Streptomyces sp. ML-6 TaxID=2982693 RepID=UPI0024C05DE6|nr:DUF6210 family protein [Streptomyces sp. ML-6]MDK0524487.1 DUF6210 family protein [Streptomyces sp. ML-6]